MRSFSLLDKRAFWCIWNINVIIPHAWSYKCQFSLPWLNTILKRGGGRNRRVVDKALCLPYGLPVCLNVSVGWMCSARTVSQWTSPFTAWGSASWMSKGGGVRSEYRVTVILRSLITVRRDPSVTSRYLNTATPFHTLVRWSLAHDEIKFDR
jgi:hypothetical protein